MSKETKIIAVANQKGGVGKTTTVVNLATALAACGKKVLIIDSDPQGNASTGLGYKKDQKINIDLYLILTKQISVNQSIIKTNIPNLSIIPTTVNLTAIEQEFVNLSKREYQLKNIINAINLSFEYIIIDCPPSLGLLTINALSAAKNLIVPLQVEFYALEGLSQLMKTFDLVKMNFNNDLYMNGIVLTMFDKRNKLSELVETDVRNHFKEKVFKTVIPRNIRISEAPSHGLPILMYDITCSGSQAYAALAAEIITQEGELKSE